MLVICALPNPSQMQIQGTTVKLKSAEAPASWKPSVIKLRGDHRGRVVWVSEQIELHNSSSRPRLSEEVL